MPRRKAISFIPSSVNFSELGEGKEDFDIEEILPGAEDDRSGLWVEKTILTMMSVLPTDREKAILLLQIMRGDGYNFDQKSIARLFGVQVRWYMRVVQGIKRKIIKAGLCD